MTLIRRSRRKNCGDEETRGVEDKLVFEKQNLFTAKDAEVAKEKD